MLSTSDDTEIRNEIDVTLDLEAVNVLLTALLKIAEPRFYGFPLRDVLNYYCWMATLPAPALDARGIQLEGVDSSLLITELATSIARVNLNVTCVECSSPRMFELTELLSSSAAQKEATEVFNHILGYVAELLGGTYLQVQIDRMLNDAARKCPHRPEYDFDASEVVYEPFEVPQNEYSTTYLALLGGVTLGLTLVVVFVTFCVRCFVRRRHRKSTGSSTGKRASAGIADLQQHDVDEYQPRYPWFYSLVYACYSRRKCCSILKWTHEFGRYCEY
jgi:hypothetical protein